MFGHLPFQVGGNIPRDVHLPHVESQQAVIDYANAIINYTSARIERGIVSELFDIDLAEKEGGSYHSTRFLVVVNMRDHEGVRHSTVIPAPLDDLLEIRRGMWCLKDIYGEIITKAYARLIGLAEENLTFDQGVLVG